MCFQLKVGSLENREIKHSRVAANFTRPQILHDAVTPPLYVRGVGCRASHQLKHQRYDFLSHFTTSGWLVCYSCGRRGLGNLNGLGFRGTARVWSIVLFAKKYQKLWPFVFEGCAGCGKLNRPLLRDRIKCRFRAFAIPPPHFFPQNPTAIFTSK